MATESKTSGSSWKHSALVGAGILLSKISGFVRERALAHYLGNSDAGDVFRAGLRIPNFLQNLFGEGVLSASFIPVYSSLLAEEKKELARRVASIVLTLLALATSLLVLLGISYAPLLTDLIAPGFSGEKREALILLVRILFPGVGLLVLSAWCLGILNSHRSFFLPYAAPVIWNGAIIAALLLVTDATAGYRVAEVAAWGVVLGSALQLAVQLPKALRLLGGILPSANVSLEPVRAVLKNFVPVVFGRGVVQVSAYVDSILASLLASGSVAALGYAQTIYLVPVSLFGMSVSAAELPAMSSEVGNTTEVRERIRMRLQIGLRRVLFLIVPSMVAFFAIGDLLTGLLFESGRFGRTDTLYVWGIIAAASVGLIPATLGRLYASSFYAQRDTRTPLWCAISRVIVAAFLGYAFAFRVPPLIGLEPKWGTAFIALAGALGAWLEYQLLRKRSGVLIGETNIPREFIVKLFASALLAAVAASFPRFLMAGVGIALMSVVSLVVYGSCYFALTALLQVPETQGLLRRVQRAPK